MNEEKFKKVSKILTAIANTNGIYDYIIEPAESELLIEYLSWVWEKIHFSEKQLEESKAEANTFRQLAVSEARKHNDLKRRIGEAIEYINNCGYNYWCYGGADEEIIRILKGNCDE